MELTRTGPQYYPLASQAYWYEDNYPGSPMEVNVGVVHTTEGTSLPSYGGGATAPNFTAVPDFGRKKLKWYQHFRVDTSSRALVNAPGGVETNTANSLQVELVGTCDLTTHKRWNDQGARHIFWPAAPDWAQLEVAKFVRWLADEHGLPMKSELGGSPLPFKAYPGSYGSNGVRLSYSQWRSFTGWLGHQHVPENHHGDPGALPMQRILAFARDKTWEKEDLDMTPEQVHKAVWGLDKIPAPENAPTRDTNPTWKAENFLRDIDKRVRDMEDRQAAQGKKLDAILDKLGI